MIDISGLDKARVLRSLYNNAKTQGMGILHYIPGPLDINDARDLLDKKSYFDYLKGRVLKVDLSGDSFDPWGYDRDNGQGAAENAVAAVLLDVD